MNLCRPTVVKDLLARHGLRPSRGLGQNFLVDRNYLEKIVGSAEITPADTVLEIGPGLGAMTYELAQAGAEVVAIEKDRHLQPVLEETLAGLPVRLRFDDALEVDFAELLENARHPKVVANLPYYVTTPLILALLQSQVSWVSLTFLVQREVVPRIMAKPGQKEYGILSIAAQYYTEPQFVTTVPASAFYPAPQVASAVIRLMPQDTAKFGLQVDSALLWQVAKAALGRRRKTLLNALSALPGHSREELQQVISALRWSPDRRGETLTVEELVALTNRLCN
jgi:16S rRNA (adenine1518-N6/adenine1519-N6)-dimethyltransferase